MKKSMFIKKRHIKTTIKCVNIIKNNNITGVEYGLTEVPTTAEIIVLSPKNKEKKLKEQNNKHNSVKNTRIKTESVEKETKTAHKKPKRKYRMRINISYSYNLKSSQRPVDLNKKRFRKAKDLFEKKQRLNKIALQNLAQQLTNIEPISDFIKDALNSIKQKNR